MAVRKVYGHLNSTATMRVLASLYEHEVEFVFVPVDMKSGEHKKEHFLSLNPFGQVPVYQDGDLTLFESRAIMRAIAFDHPKKGREQIYMEPKMQGIAAIWTDVEDHQFDPPASNLIRELVDKPKNGLATEEAVVVEEEAKLAKVLNIYEDRLTESRYLGWVETSSPQLISRTSLTYTTSWTHQLSSSSSQGHESALGAMKSWLDQLGSWIHGGGDAK